MTKIYFHVHHYRLSKRKKKISEFEQNSKFRNKIIEMNIKKQKYRNEDNKIKI